MVRKKISSVMAVSMALVSLLVLTASVWAQQDANDALRRTFGLGVHQYNAGNIVDAYNTFSECVALKSENPSVYYYRGLCLLQLERADDAADDFKTGTELELKYANSPTITQVGYDLLNVQGELRETLEKYRNDVKLKAYQNRKTVEAMQLQAKTVNKYLDPSSTPLVDTFEGEDAPGSWSVDGGEATAPDPEAKKAPAKAKDDSDLLDDADEDGDEEEGDDEEEEEGDEEEGDEEEGDEEEEEEEEEGDEEEGDEEAADDSKAEKKADDVKAEEKEEKAEEKADDAKAEDEEKADEEKADDAKAEDDAKADDEKADDAKAEDDAKADDEKAEEKADDEEKSPEAKANEDEAKADADEKEADAEEDKADADEKKAETDEEKADEEKADADVEKAKADVKKVEADDEEEVAPKKGADALDE